MRIGFDLDHTLINYSNSIRKLLKLKKIVSKEEIKKKFKRKEDWQHFQKELYSKGLSYAKLSKDAINIISLFNKLKIDVFIVSHKTNKTYFKSKVNLKEYAFDWIKKNILKKTHIKKIYFENTQEKKIQRINNLNLNFFLDDLISIVKKIKKCKGILFDPYNKIKFTNKITSFLEIFKQITKYKKIKSDGINNLLFNFEINKKKIILKKFNIKLKKKCLSRETKFLKALNESKIKSTPQLYTYGEDYLIESYIQGDKIKKIDQKSLQQIVLFIKEINSEKIKNKLKKDKIGMASDSCESYIKNIKNVDRRIAQVKKSLNSIDNIKLKKFLETRFIPYWQVFKSKINPKYTQKFFREKNLILSPSDLSIKNIIKVKNKLFFFDFEYAGFDNVFKLICDFLCHPDHNLDEVQKKYFVDKMIKIVKFKETEKNNEFLNDLILIHTFKWVLVMLNDFNLKKLEIRNFLGRNENKYQLQKKINKAIQYYDSNVLKYEKIKFF